MPDTPGVLLEQEPQLHDLFLRMASALLTYMRELRERSSFMEADASGSQDADFARAHRAMMQRFNSYMLGLEGFLALAPELYNWLEMHVSGEYADRFHARIAALQKAALDADKPTVEVPIVPAHCLLSATVWDVGEFLIQLYDMLAQREGSPAHAPAAVGQQPWQDEADGYLPASEAVKLTDGWSLSRLNKALTDGPIRYMSKGHRCKVHIEDLYKHLRTLPADKFREASFTAYFEGAKQRKADILAGKKRTGA